MTSFDDSQLRALWRGQSIAAREISPEELQARALQFEKQIRRRNLRDHLSFALTAILIGAGGVMIPGVLVKTGALLLVAWCLYSMWGLHRFGAALQFSADASGESCAAFQLRQLERQRDIVLSWPLGIGLGLPGFALLSVGLGLGARYPNWEFPAALIGVFLFLYVALIIHGRIQAAQWQREIDWIRSMRKAE